MLSMSELCRAQLFIPRDTNFELLFAVASAFEMTDWMIQDAPLCETEPNTRRQKYRSF